MNIIFETIIIMKSFHLDKDKGRTETKTKINTSLGKDQD